MPSPLVLRLARGSAVLWVAARIAGAVFGPLRPLPFGIVFFPVLVLILVWVDVSVTGERVLLGNLGVGPATVSAIVLPVAASLELLLALALGFAP